jgi:hypothetical protein
MTESERPSILDGWLDRSPRVPTADARTPLMRCRRGRQLAFCGERDARVSAGGRLVCGVRVFAVGAPFPVHRPCCTYSRAVTLLELEIEHRHAELARNRNRAEEEP